MKPVSLLYNRLDQSQKEITQIFSEKQEDIFYASVLDGRVMFGDYHNCPMDDIENTIVIDTITYENVDFQHPNLRKFDLKRHFEPEYREKFTKYMVDLYNEIFSERINSSPLEIISNNYIPNEKKKKRVYIFDEDGTRASTIFASYLIRYYHINIHVTTIFNKLEAAYNARTNKPEKWSNCKIPRIERHRAFTFAELNHRHFESYKSCFKERVKSATKRNRIAKVKGQVRCGYDTPFKMGSRYRDLYVEGFLKIVLERERNKIKDYPELLIWWPQKKTIKYRTYGLTGESYIDYARSVRNLFHSICVYEDELIIDSNGQEKLSPDFYRVQIQLSHSSQKITRHPFDRNFTIDQPQEPKYLYWQNELLPYKEWKPYIFSAIYERVIRMTDSYLYLVKLRNAGTNLFFLEKEGFDFVEEGMTIQEHFKTCNGNWGPAQILVCMMQGLRPWTEKIDIDNDLWMAD